MRVVVLGAGYTGRRVAALAQSRGEAVLAVVRSETREAELRAAGIPVTRAPVLDVAASVDEDVQVVIAFPPDGTTDARLAPALARAGSIAYVSTTSVYGDARAIDDTTPVTASPSPAQARVLAAEAAYRALGATVLRAPGIYGPDRGLHVRVRSGIHKMPGDGANVGSRIHADDLAALLLAARTVRGETFVVGDLEPARQRDVVQWICAEHGCAMPPSVPAEEVPESLRRDRRVDGSRALARLGIALRYPTFREGMGRARSSAGSA